MFTRQFSVFRRIQTSQPPEVVFDVVGRALLTAVGGSISRNGNVFTIHNGTNNLSLAFVANVTANIVLTQPAPGVIDIHGTVVLNPSSAFWVMAGLGFFCLWFLWGFNAVYFIMDPRINYQLALDGIYLADGAAPLATPFG